MEEEEDEDEEEEEEEQEEEEDEHNVGRVFVLNSPPCRSKLFPPFENDSAIISLASVSMSMSKSSAACEQGLTLVHFSAQPEPFLTQNTPLTSPSTP